jgi:hypothetical protein
MARKREEEALVQALIDIYADPRMRDPHFAGHHPIARGTHGYGKYAPITLKGEKLRRYGLKGIPLPQLREFGNAPYLKWLESGTKEMRSKEAALLNKFLRGSKDTYLKEKPGPARRVTRKSLLWDWLPDDYKMRSTGFHPPDEILGEIERQAYSKPRPDMPTSKKRYEDLQKAIKKLGKVRGIAPLMIVGLLASLFMGED